MRVWASLYYEKIILRWKQALGQCIQFIHNRLASLASRGLKKKKENIKSSLILMQFPQFRIRTLYFYDERILHTLGRLVLNPVVQKIVKDS